MNIARCIFFLATLPLLWSCHTVPAPRPHPVALPDENLVGVNSLFVAPLQVDSGIILSPVVLKHLDQALWDVVSRELDGRLVNGAGITTAPVAPRGPMPAVSTYEQTVVRHAAQQSCDSVLSVDLHEFTERIGSRIGASRPARISFSARILSVPGGRLLWSVERRVDSIDASQNLLRAFEPGGSASQGFPEASSLFATALSQELKLLSERRREQFIRSPQNQIPLSP